MHAPTRSKLGTRGIVVATVVATALTVAVSSLVITSVDGGFGSSRSRSSISATWSASQVTLGSRATVQGRVSSKRLERRAVNLFVYLKSGWRRVGYTHTTGTGRYSITVPTTYYFSRPMQLRSPATRQAQAVVSPRRTFTVVPSYTPVGSYYSRALAVPGVETRVNPCATVPYRINTGVPMSGAASGVAVQAALARITEATGIKFRYLGPTTAFPRPRGEAPTPWPTDATLVVAWAQPDDSQTFFELGGDPRFAIYSQSAILATRTAHDAQGPVRRITRAGVVLDAAPDPTSGAISKRSWVLMHELASALGLGSVKDPTQKLSEVIPDTVDPADSTWGKGDLAGLSQIGLVEGCVTDGKR